MMRAPAFWATGRPGVVATLLAPLGAIYGAMTLRRMRRKGAKAGVPVIAIGNFTVGGGGKTPTTLALAANLTRWGERPFVITRGYGGTVIGPVRVDLARYQAPQVGDEALLLARHVPTIVARDRAEGARLAEAEGASIILLDDALHNPSLQRNLTIAVVDGGFGFGNGLCLPAGPLRAPLAPSLNFVDLVMIIGADEQGAAQALGDLPIVSSMIVPDEAVLPAIAGQRIVAFAGIARPEKFFTTLREAGGKLVGQRAFGDHHPFREADAAALLAEAARLDARLVTTEKDHVRLSGGTNLNTLAQKSLALPIGVPLPPVLLEHVQRVLSDARRASTASGLA
jgi:tetraacyldisaccharide 4'-kinase